MNKKPDKKRDLRAMDERIEALKGEQEAVRQQTSNLDRTMAKLVAERKKIAADIKRGEQKPTVSDHAVLRYLERIHGFDFEAVRASILTDAVAGAIEAGAKAIKFADGTLRIKDKTVVTFIARADVPVNQRQRFDEAMQLAG